MKKTLFLLSCIFFISCEKPSDCIESLGETITREVPVTDFTKIEVYKGIELIIKQGTENKLQIVTGENIIDDIEVSQEGNILRLRENASCNWVREYGQTKIYVTTNNLEVIYSKTDRKISSYGILNFPRLTVFAFDKEADDIEGAGTGDVYLNINTTEFVINSNNVARFFIEGATYYGNFYFWAGDTRLDASGLTIQESSIYHRGSNDMILKPIQAIRGKLVSTGNIILKNNPPIIEVEELYQGQVIFN
jgi:hypothetical protein